MDELVQDLSAALDSSKAADIDDQALSCLTPRVCKRKSRKSRRKRRSIDPSFISCLSRPTECGGDGGGGNLSEASETSLEEALKDYMENVTASSKKENSVSDSDDAKSHTQRLENLKKSLNSLRGTGEPQDEFFTANQEFCLNPVTRKPRKLKKKCKMMAVDPSMELEAKSLSAVAGFATLNVSPGVKSKKQRSVGFNLGNPRTPLLPASSSQTAVGSPEDSHMDHSGEVVRAINADEHDMEFSDSDNNDHDQDKAVESDGDSSSISSSSCGDGLFTNDEGREGDDEQSDFFHEPGGSAYGVPGIINWWDTSRAATNEVDPNFDRILNGVFPLMTKSSQRGFQTRLKRLHNAGDDLLRRPHRNLHGLVSGKMEMRIRQFLKDPRQTELRLYSLKKKQRKQLLHLASTCSLSLRMEGKNSRHGYTVLTKQSKAGGGGSGGGLPGLFESGIVASTLQGGAALEGDAKRRKKTFPFQQPPGYVGGNAEPIPDSNVGNQMLQAMGWTPGSGLGAERDGIRQPILAYLRPKGLGLGLGHTTLQITGVAGARPPTGNRSKARRGTMSDPDT